MRLDEHETKMHLTNAEVIVLRELYANDPCACGELRVSHYLPGGATSWCQKPGCRCTAYTWVGR